MKHLVIFLVLGTFLTLFSCADREEERVAVPPKSSSSTMPWNRPQPGEGAGQFGGMLQRR
jgi:hypothetical protein